jgi:hypothetical protein
LPAGFADPPGGVGEVIFPRSLAVFGAVGIRDSLGIAREMAQRSQLDSGLGLVSGHLALLTRLPRPGTESQRSVTTSSMAWGSATSNQDHERHPADSRWLLLLLLLSSLLSAVGSLAWTTR